MVVFHIQIFQIKYQSIWAIFLWPDINVRYVLPFGMKCVLNKSCLQKLYWFVVKLVGKCYCCCSGFPFLLWSGSDLFVGHWDLRPGQTLATFQRNILQHCCMTLRTGWPNARNIHHNMLLFTSPRPLALGCRPKISMEVFEWYRASGSSAHALAQQSCVNVAKRVQHHATSKMLHEKFDRFQIWSNIIQHVATYRNRVAKRTQHVVPNNVARCCVEMLRAFGQAFT